MRFQPRIFIILILLLLSSKIEAEQVNVQGKIFAISSDSTAMPLEYANIVLLNASDSSLIKGTTSDKKGAFRISFDAKTGVEYFVKASFLGYETKTRDIGTIKQNIDIGDIILNKFIPLKEIEIKATRQPLVHIGDTAVYDAESFQLPDGSYLEELIKRLPGLEYDEFNNTITYQGYKIGSIKLNGESFFDNDISMALKNLPHDIIANVKVYDKRPEMEKLTGIKSPDNNYVLDIITKAEFDGTIMLSATASAGNHNKKSGNIFGNYTRQNGDGYSLVANGGNRNSMSEYKHNHNLNIGMNFNKKLSNKIKLHASVNYSDNKNGGETASYDEQYLPTENRYSNNTNTNVNTAKSISSYLRLEWKPDDKTIVNAGGQISHAKNDNEGESRQALFSENPHLNLLNPFESFDTIPRDIIINSSRGISFSDNSSTSYGMNFSGTRKVGSKGACITISANVNGSGSDNNRYTMSSANYYRLQGYNGNDSVFYRNQYQNSPTNNFNISATIGYVYPITNKTRISASYIISHNNQDNDHTTYDLSGYNGNDMPFPYLPPGYEASYIDSLSDIGRSKQTRNELRFLLNFNNDMWQISALIEGGLLHRRLSQKVGFQYGDSSHNTPTLRPSINITFKKGSRRWNFSYIGNFNEPSLSDLLSLTNNSDPLNITKGNPDLKRSYSQGFRFTFMETKLGINANIYCNNTINQHTQALTYDMQTGARTTMPVNINGNYGLGATLNFAKRIKEFYFNINLNSSYNHAVQLINEGRTSNPEKSTSASKFLSPNIYVTYTKKWCTINVSGRASFNNSKNSLLQTKNNTQTYSAATQLLFALPHNIKITTSMAFSSLAGTNIVPHRDDQFRWDAQASWSFLKGKQMELSASWNDILGQNKQIYVSTGSSGYNEHYNRQIRSYFIISLKYTFRKKFQSTPKKNNDN